MLCGQQRCGAVLVMILALLGQSAAIGWTPRRPWISSPAAWNRPD
jgi:hypothetical protein